MGYFSDLTAKESTYKEDCSYTSPQQQMKWRVDALKERLEELTSQHSGRRDEGVCFSQEDLRYVLPEHFFSAEDVRKAIALAEAFGIDDTTAQETEITGVQLSFVDALLVQKAQCAA